MKVDSQGQGQEDGNKYAALSSYLGSPTHSSEPGSPPPVPNALSAKPAVASSSKEYPYLTVRGKSSDSSEPGTSSGTFVKTSFDDGIASVVENILAHRKEFRRCQALSRMYRTPFQERKKKKVRVTAPLEEIR